MILDLLFINVIVALVYMSGFWDSLDYYINKSFKPYHLPHLFQCNLCMCFWCSLLYCLIFQRPFLILTAVAYSLINAHLVDITIPLLSTIKSWLQKLIEWIMPR